MLHLGLGKSQHAEHSSNPTFSLILPGCLVIKCPCRPIDVTIDDFCYFVMFLELFD